MNIGTTIRTLREKNARTMKEMAEFLDVAVITYNHYETQEKIIPLIRLNELANYFGVSIDYLFGLTSKLNYENVNTTLDSVISGGRLKDFRKEQKLTQLKLAFVLNTVHPTIAYYEKGRNLISTAFLYTICKKYKISADYLLGRIDNPKYLK